MNGDYVPAGRYGGARYVTREQREVVRVRAEIVRPLLDRLEEAQAPAPPPRQRPWTAPPEPFWQRLRRLRHARGLSRDELARLVGVGLSTISWWELDVTHPLPERLPGLSSALGVPLDELTGGTP